MDGVEAAQRRLGERGRRRADRTVYLEPEESTDGGGNADQRLWGRPSQSPGHFDFDERGGDKGCVVMGVDPGDKVSAMCLLADQLDDGGGVEIDHQRSSSRMSARVAATSTSSSPSLGGSGTAPPPVGATARPAATSLARVDRSPPTGTSRAIGCPRSVISTVSPLLTRARTWLVFWFNSRIPMRSMWPMVEHEVLRSPSLR